MPGLKLYRYSKRAPDNHCLTFSYDFPFQLHLWHAPEGDPGRGIRIIRWPVDLWDDLARPTGTQNWRPRVFPADHGGTSAERIQVWYCEVGSVIRDDMFIINYKSLQWRHNDRDGVPNHQLHNCLLNRLFKAQIKETSKIRVTSLCAENSPVTGEFPAQRASYAENVSIWWRHHVAWCMDLIGELFISSREDYLVFISQVVKQRGK